MMILNTFRGGEKYKFPSRNNRKAMGSDKRRKNTEPAPSVVCQNSQIARNSGVRKPMLHAFRKLLEKADGRSEFAIVVVCDIRGFSAFSKIHESPDTAMFIKRFYLKLIDEYFPTAHFVKPTGDGILMIYRYTEDNLNDISKGILEACLNCVNDFHALFKEDPMINFETPQNIGFGITRGPVCCLFSGKQIIDYFGRLLNLAPRLMDLARPRGIVIDGNYLLDVIPEELRERFKDHDAYIRSIAEETPHLVYYLSPEVELPDYCLHPIKK